MADNNNDSGGGFFNSNLAYLLPIALGAASAFAPGLGRAAGAVFQGFDWINQQRKEQRRLSSLKNVGNVVTQAQTQGKYPTPADLIAASGGNLEAVKPWADLFAGLSRETPMNLPGGGLGAVSQSPTGGMRISQLMPGESEVSRAKQELIESGIQSPTAEQIRQRMEQSKLQYQRATQGVHTEGAVEQARQLGPIQTQTAVNTAAGVAPIHTGQAIATAQGLLPAQKQHAKDISDIQEGREMKPNSSWLTAIDKREKEIASELEFSTTPLSDEQKQELIDEKARMKEARKAILKSGLGKMGIGEPITTPAPTTAPPPPGKFAKPTAKDLADYRTAVKNGNPNARATAIKLWGYAP